MRKRRPIIEIPTPEEIKDGINSELLSDGISKLNFVMNVVKVITADKLCNHIGCSQNVAKIIIGILQQIEVIDQNGNNRIPTEPSRFRFRGPSMYELDSNGNVQTIHWDS